MLHPTTHTVHVSAESHLQMKLLCVRMYLQALLIYMFGLSSLFFFVVVHMRSWRWAEKTKWAKKEKEIHGKRAKNEQKRKETYFEKEKEKEMNETTKLTM